jgi:arylsulfatase
MSINKDKANKTRTQRMKERQQAVLLSDILPMPDPRFKGHIGNTYADSKADVISLPTPPSGAPNVLLVLLDDVGFGQTSTFGGPANTPTLQKLANEGFALQPLSHDGALLADASGIAHGS